MAAPFVNATPVPSAADGRFGFLDTGIVVESSSGGSQTPNKARMFEAVVSKPLALAFGLPLALPSAGKLWTWRS